MLSLLVSIISANPWITVAWLSFLAKLSYFIHLWKNYPSESSFIGRLGRCIRYIFRSSVHVFAKVYYRYEVHGQEKIKTILEKKQQPVLLVGYHSRCLVDLYYVMSAIDCRLVVSHLWFRVAVFGQVLPYFDAIPSHEPSSYSTSTGKNAITGFKDALRKTDKPLLLLPGGVVECMKPFQFLLKVHWKKPVPGYIRILDELCHENNNKKSVVVVPFHTKNCEKILFTTQTLFSKLGDLTLYLHKLVNAGNILLIPFMMTSSILACGCAVLQLPVKLDTYIGDPLEWSPDSHETAEEFAQRVEDATQALIDQTEDHIQTSFPSKFTVLELIEYYVIMCFTMLQNVYILIPFFLAFIWMPWPYFIGKYLFDLVFGSKGKEMKEVSKEAVSNKKNGMKKKDSKKEEVQVDSTATDYEKLKLQAKKREKGKIEKAQ